MTAQDITIKAYEEKIRAALQQIKGQLTELEGRAKGKGAQAEIDAIQRLKAKDHELEKKHQELRTVGEAKVEHLKSEIDAEIARFKASLAELSAKLKVEGQKRAG